MEDKNREVWGQVMDKVRDQARGQAAGRVWDQATDQVGWQALDRAWVRMGGHIFDQLEEEFDEK